MGTESGAPAGLPSPRYAVVLVAVAVIVAAIFLFGMLAATDGHFVPQVVDLYLVAQYAKVLAEGHPFQYVPGDPPSTGATSLLHTAILAAVHAVGIRGEGLIAFAVLLGAALLVAAVLVAQRAGEQAGGRDAGILAGLLVALGGPVVWAFLYGSDIALFLFLALWLFERLLASWGSPVPTPWVVPATVLALARPEGLPLAVLIGAAWLADARGRATIRGRLLALLPVLAGLAVLALYKVVTGSWLGTSVADKSLFAAYGLAQGIALSAEYGVDVVRGLLLGLYPSQVPVGLSRGWAPYFLPPFALVFAGAAAVLAPRGTARPIVVWLASSAAVAALVTPNTFIGSHFQRYVLWAIPPVAVLAAAGLRLLADRVGPPGALLGRRVFVASAAVWVALAGLATARFAVVYAEMGADVWRRDVAAASWIARHLPPGVHIANLATSVEYLTGHHNINLHGVTSPTFFGGRAPEREAGVFETLSRLPAAERPPYLLTSTTAMEIYPSMRELVAAPPLFRTSSFGDELEVYALRYDVFGSAAQPQSARSLSALDGLQEVDRLNVGDPRDERAHDYAFVSRAGIAPLFGTVRADRYGDSGPRVMDAGRPILGKESFRVRTLPGRDLLIVLRTAPQVDGNLMRVGGPVRIGIEFAEAGLILSVDGTTTGRTSTSLSPGWNELVLRVTGNLVHEDRTTVEVVGRYASFHYWFYQ